MWGIVGGYDLKLIINFYLIEFFPEVLCKFLISPKVLQLVAWIEYYLLSTVTFC